MKTNEDYVNEYKDLVMLSCSGDTIATYVTILTKWLDFIDDPATATSANFLKFLHTFKSHSSKKQAKGALLHFYKGVLPREGLVKKLPKIKEEQKLPEILTQREVSILMQSIPNLKHRAIITLLYHCGLRIGELLNIQIKDLSSASLSLHIKFSKGAKQRIVPFSDEVKDLLFEYFRKYQPETYLFNGQGNLKYSAGSVRKFLSREVKRIGVTKNITPHSLRHSRATHLLMNGIDIKFIKELLGHSKLETTERYTRLNVKDLRHHIRQADHKMKQAIQAA